MIAIPRVLLAGNDVISLRTWKMMLDIQFKATVSARFSEAVSEIQREPFDLIVICNDPEKWKQIADLASSNNPSVKVIVITLTEEEHPAWADAVLCGVRGPYELLKLCTELFGLPSKMRAHGFSLGGTGTYIPKRSKTA